MQGYFLNSRLSNTVKCQREYNAASARVQGARGDAADQDRKALDIMIATIFSTTDRNIARNAIETYLRTRKEADAQRAKNPLPDYPNC
jgi:hypothetical protein